MRKKNLNAKKKIHNFYFKKLKDPRIKKIYLSFKKKLDDNNINNFCVAVSGGEDSLALTFWQNVILWKKTQKLIFLS